MKNTPKTAQEEKRMLDEIYRMSDTLKYLPQIAKLNEKKDSLYKEFKVFRGQAK